MNDTQYIIEDIDSRVLSGERHLLIVFSDVKSQRIRGNETTGECPFCGKKDKFYMSNIKPFFHCKRCDERGNFYTYLSKRKNMSFPQALEYLAEQVGVKLPERKDLTPEQKQAYERSARRSSLIEDAFDYFQQKLWEPEGAHVLQYLRDRGYPDQALQKMDIGAYFDQGALIQYLGNLGHSEEEVNRAGLLKPALGSSHQIAFLWRGRSGRAEGLGFRRIQEDAEPKYLYSQGLKRSRSMLGLQRSADAVVIVEGLIDALYLNALDISAASLGGASLSREQVEHLKQTQVKQVYLALDQDEAGQQGTIRALQYLESYSPLVVSFNRHKDPDEMIRAEGAEAFIKEIQLANYWVSWRVEAIYNKYQSKLYTPAVEQKALHEAIEFYLTLNRFKDQRLARDKILLLFDIQEEELEQELISWRESQSQKELKQTLQRDLSELGQLSQQGDYKALQSKLMEAYQNLRSKQAAHPDEPYTVSEWLMDIETIGEGLSTGLKKLDDAHIRIPEGALTLIAGRPGHGKTTLMLNIFLNMIRVYQDKRFFFFTYEESRARLMLKLLLILSGAKLHKEDNQGALLNYLKFKRSTHPDKRIEEPLAILEHLTATGRLMILDQSTQRLTADELAGLISHYSEQGNIGACFVDYIQKLPVGKSEFTGARYLEIKRASELLLEQAVSTNIPIIMGAQLNRESRGKPKAAQLRESGDLEQDASLIIGLLNEAVEGSEEGEPVDKKEEIFIEAHILKNRGGQQGGMRELIFSRPTLRIK